MSADKLTEIPEENSSKDTIATSTAPRKPYQAPQLTLYGSIQKLTNTTSKGAKVDGGSKPKNMRTCL